MRTTPAVRIRSASVASVPVYPEARAARRRTVRRDQTQGP